LKIYKYTQWGNPLICLKKKEIKNLYKKEALSSRVPQTTSGCMHFNRRVHPMWEKVGERNYGKENVMWDACMWALFLWTLVKNRAHMHAIFPHFLSTVVWRRCSKGLVVKGTGSSVLLCWHKKRERRLAQLGLDPSLETRVARVVSFAFSYSWMLGEKGDSSLKSGGGERRGCRP
jgi:hypothetical protein